MKITHHIVFLENLPKEFAGYRILQISDLHIGRGNPERKIFSLIAEIDADIAVLTGDIVHRRKHIEQAKEFLHRLALKLKPADGLWGIFGNHEIELNGDEFEGGSVRWLRNSIATVKRGDNAINFLGLDQRAYATTDMISPLFEVDNSGVIIVFAHLPSTAMLMNGVISLVVAGHTHGGQIRIPGLPFMTNDDISWRNGIGLTRIGATQLVVSAGVGYSGPISMRLFAPPEITVVELQRE